MLTIEGGGDRPVVLSGRLDATQAAATQSYLDGLQGIVTLDCADLQYLSSAGSACSSRRTSGCWRGVGGCA